MKVKCIEHGDTFESNSVEARKHISCDWSWDVDGKAK